MKKIIEYVNSENIKDVPDDVLESVFSYMVYHMGRIKVELNRRISKNITKKEIREYLEKIR